MCGLVNVFSSKASWLVLAHTVEAAVQLKGRTGVELDQSTGDGEGFTLKVTKQLLDLYFQKHPGLSENGFDPTVGNVGIGHIKLPTDTKEQQAARDIIAAVFARNGFGADDLFYGAMGIDASDLSTRSKNVIGDMQQLFIKKPQEMKWKDFERSLRRIANEVREEVLKKGDGELDKISIHSLSTQLASYKLKIRPEQALRFTINAGAEEEVMAGLEKDGIWPDSYKETIRNDPQFGVVYFAYQWLNKPELREKMQVHSAWDDFKNTNCAPDAAIAQNRFATNSRDTAEPHHYSMISQNGENGNIQGRIDFYEAFFEEVLQRKAHIPRNQSDTYQNDMIFSYLNIFAKEDIDFIIIREIAERYYNRKDITEEERAFFKWLDRETVKLLGPGFFVITDPENTATYFKNDLVGYRTAVLNHFTKCNTIPGAQIMSIASENGVLASIPRKYLKDEGGIRNLPGGGLWRVDWETMQLIERDEILRGVMQRFKQKRQIDPAEELKKRSVEITYDSQDRFRLPEDFTIEDVLRTLGVDKGRLDVQVASAVKTANASVGAMNIMVARPYADKRMVRSVSDQTQQAGAQITNPATNLLTEAEFFTMISFLGHNAAKYPDAAFIETTGVIPYGYRNSILNQGRIKTAVLSPRFEVRGTTSSEITRSMLEAMDSTVEQTREAITNGAGIVDISFDKFEWGIQPIDETLIANFLNNSLKHSNMYLNSSITINGNGLTGHEMGMALQGSDGYYPSLLYEIARRIAHETPGITEEQAISNAQKFALKMVQSIGAKKGINEFMGFKKCSLMTATGFNTDDPYIAKTFEGIPSEIGGFTTVELAQNAMILQATALLARHKVPQSEIDQIYEDVVGKTIQEIRLENLTPEQRTEANRRIYARRTEIGLQNLTEVAERLPRLFDDSVFPAILKLEREEEALLAKPQENKVRLEAIGKELTELWYWKHAQDLFSSQVNLTYGGAENVLAGCADKLILNSGQYKAKTDGVIKYWGPDSIINKRKLFDLHDEDELKLRVRLQETFFENVKIDEATIDGFLQRERQSYKLLAENQGENTRQWIEKLLEEEERMLRKYIDAKTLPLKCGQGTRENVKNFIAQHSLNPAREVLAAFLNKLEPHAREEAAILFEATQANKGVMPDSLSWSTWDSLREFLLANSQVPQNQTAAIVEETPAYLRKVAEFILENKWALRFLDPRNVYDQLPADRYSREKSWRYPKELADAHKCPDDLLEYWAASEQFHQDNPQDIQDFIKFKNDKKALTWEEMEDTVGSVSTYHCNFPGMSAGSIKPTPHKQIAKVENATGSGSNSGEGPPDLARHPGGHEEAAYNRIAQFASGRFGADILLALSTMGFDVYNKDDPNKFSIKFNGNQVDFEIYVTEEGILEIKIAQGAKLYEGGELHGEKVGPEIAISRNLLMGQTAISPSNSYNKFSVEDLKRFADVLRFIITDARGNLRSPEVSVKIAADDVNFKSFAKAAQKAGADILNIADGTGGTGAAKHESMLHTGTNIFKAVRDAHLMFMEDGTRSTIKIKASGGVRNIYDIAKVVLEGANKWEPGKNRLEDFGCVGSATCNTGCPALLTTGDGYNESERQAERMRYYTSHGVLNILRQLGISSVEKAVGRADEFLEQRSQKELRHAGVRGTWKLTDTLLRAPKINPALAANDNNISKVQETKHPDQQIIPQVRKVLTLQNDTRRHASRIMNEGGERVLFVTDPREMRQLVAHVKAFVHSAQHHIGRDLAAQLALEAYVSGEVGADWRNTKNAVRLQKQRLDGGNIKVIYVGTVGDNALTFHFGVRSFVESGNANFCMSGNSGIVTVSPSAESYSPSFNPQKNHILTNSAFYGATSIGANINGNVGRWFGVRSSNFEGVVHGSMEENGFCFASNTSAIVVPESLSDIGDNFCSHLMSGAVGVFDAKGTGSLKIADNAKVVTFSDLGSRRETHNVAKRMQQASQYLLRTYADEVGEHANREPKNIVDLAGDIDKTVQKMPLVFPKDQAEILLNGSITDLMKYRQRIVLSTAGKHMTPFMAALKLGILETAQEYKNEALQFLKDEAVYGRLR